MRQNKAKHVVSDVFLLSFLSPLTLTFTHSPSSSPLTELPQGKMRSDISRQLIEVRLMLRSDLPLASKILDEDMQTCDKHVLYHRFYIGFT